jgi:hypothetical protein
MRKKLKNWLFVIGGLTIAGASYLLAIRCPLSALFVLIVGYGLGREVDKLDQYERAENKDISK